MAKSSLFAALLAALLPLAVHALREDETLFISGRAAGSLLSWGAAGPNANLTTALTVTTDPPSPSVIPASGSFVWSALFTEDQFSTVASTDLDYLCRSHYLDDPGNSFFAKRMGFANSTDSSGMIATAFSFSGLSQSATFFYLTFISCTNLDITIDLSLHYSQADGNELSSGELPFPSITSGFSIAWGVAGGLILLNLAFARLLWKKPDANLAMLSPTIAAVDPSLATPLSPIRRLHGVLLFTTAVAVGNALVSFSYYQSASKSGDYSQVVAIASIALSTVETAAIIMTILLLSRGWQVTRLTLDSNEARHVGFITVVFVAAYATFEVIPGLFFLFLLMVIFCLMLRYIFASVSLRLRVLAAFRAYSRSWLHAVSGGRVGSSTPEDDAAANGGILSVEEDSVAFYGRNQQRAAAQSGGSATSMSTRALAPNTIYVAQIPSPTAATSTTTTSPGPYTIAELPSSSARSTARAADATSSSSNVNTSSGSSSVSEIDAYAAIPVETGGEAASSVVTSDGHAQGEREPLNAFASPALEGSAGATSFAAPAASLGPAAPATRWMRFTTRVRGVLGDPHAVREGTLTSRQMQALRYFRLAIVLYLFASMLLQIWSVLSSTKAPWVGFVLTETVNILMLLYLAFLFRARPDSTNAGCLYDPYGYSAEQGLLGTNAAGSTTRGAGYGSSTSALAPASAPAPSAPSRPTLLVVQNPGDASASSSYGSSELDGRGGTSRIVLAEITETDKA